MVFIFSGTVLGSHIGKTQWTPPSFIHTLVESCPHWSDLSCMASNYNQWGLSNVMSVYMHCLRPHPNSYVETLNFLSLHGSTKERPYEDGERMQPFVNQEERVLSRNRISFNLDLVLLASRTIRNKFLLCKPCSLCYLVQTDKDVHFLVIWNVKSGIRPDYHWSADYPPA